MIAHYDPFEISDSFTTSSFLDMVATKTQKTIIVKVITTEFVVTI